MDRQQAKEILVLYRPGVAASADPRMVEALELVKHDAELKSWFDQQRALQAAIRNKFHEIPVPEELPARILAETPGRPKILRWINPVVLAAAAAIVLLAGLAAGWFAPRPDNGFPAYRKQMVRVAMREYRMNLLTNDLSQIREFLRTNGAHGDYVLTQPLAQLPGEGCAILHWHGKLVSLICFEEGKGKELMYLFVIDHSELSDGPASQNPQVQQVGQLMTASWRRGNKIYLLAAKGGEDLLRRYL
jgi:hypothetical protein